MVKIKGIDVSHWQGTIDWDKVKAAGIKFAIIKAGGSDAGFYTDSRWEANYTGAKSAGIPIPADDLGGKFINGFRVGCSGTPFTPAVKAAVLDDGRIIDISIVHIHITLDTIDLASGRILPDTVFARVGAFVGVLSYPVGIGLELAVVHALLKTGDSRAVDPDKVSGILHRFTESDGGFRNTGFGRSRLRFVIHVDRIFQLLVFQNFDEAFRISFSCGGSNAVLADEVVCADRGNGETRKQRLTAAGYDYAAVQAKVNEILSGKNASTTANYETYTVVNGDSLWGIAAKKLGSGTRYKEIKTLNGLNSDTIYAGQKLKIPKK